MVSEIFSARFTAPLPLCSNLELVSSILEASKPPGRIFPRLDSRPNRWGAPAAVSEVREDVVALEVLALSSISILTVRISPTRLARWSLKNARAPIRHSELAEAGCELVSRGAT